jgi:hypothetical protein
MHMLDRIQSRNARIAVIGLGYVGLPLAGSGGRDLRFVARAGRSRPRLRRDEQATHMLMTPDKDAR